MTWTWCWTSPLPVIVLQKLMLVRKIAMAGAAHIAHGYFKVLLAYFLDTQSLCCVLSTSVHAGNSRVCMNAFPMWVRRQVCMFDSFQQTTAGHHAHELGYWWSMIMCIFHTCVANGDQWKWGAGGDAVTFYTFIVDSF